MKHLFIPYPLALLAKEKGFDEPCFATYLPDKSLCGLVLRDMEDNPTNLLDYVWNNADIHTSVIAAPLYQQIIDWFFDVHKLDISANHMVNEGAEIEDFWQYYIMTYEGHCTLSGTWLDSRYEALNKAIEEAFKLIKKQNF